TRGNKNLRVTKGHNFRRRLWRFIHEFRYPSPDKRQAFPHTIGRVFHGDVRCPSAILSELAETKVPGEPLFIGEEAGWRPYLPLVDDMISTVDAGWNQRTIRLFTSEGVTKIVTPKSIFGRAKAYAALTWKFQRFAKLRNWRSKEGGQARDYVDALRELGFEIEIEAHKDRGGEERQLDSSVARFFPMALPFTGTEIWERIRDYFVSVYENTLFELAVFGALATSVFVGRHMVANYHLRNARAEIPLCIGGWGTRGKSGTERIKAALFSALGYGFVSKTTGCEAMFLYAHEFGRTKEMFLFRPYDKATIWEQSNVVQLSAKLGTEVFLWECMGLTPTYVEILQRQWMRDDIGTITNTYPDHEDLQGPAGVNIPEVMCDFIPEHSTLYSSEEQMLPILKEASKDLDTHLYSVNWIESGLLTRDVLERFPYEEHPFNIALVLAMAEELGIDPDYALKEMADNVVADIGVLKSYPPADYRTRKIEFTNGMSANERHGCLGNWTRLAFDTCSAVDDADKWLCTVVNNRADRISRSRVFADLLVRDISADRHVLIGSNTAGLRGYIREAWESYSTSLSLFRNREDGTPEDPSELLENQFTWMRLPIEEGHLKKRVEAILKGQPVPLEAERLAGGISDMESFREQLVSAGLAQQVDEIVSYVTDMLAFRKEYEAFAEKVRTTSGPSDSIDAEFREILWTWFSWKLVVVEDYFASGNAVVHHVCSATPPGLHARVMGLQNIKGTGLDFVYRFQAWETCHTACELLRSSNIRDLEKGLKDLADFRDYGVLSEQYVRDTIERVRRSPAAQREQFQSELGAIEGRLATTMRGVHEDLKKDSGDGGGGGKWAQILEKVCAVVEEFFDAGDAVKRRKISNVIYKDLVAERISSDRAALELSALNKRQKGGWLFDRVSQLLKAITKRRGGLMKG
ncbi:MAG: hypothetical protein AAF517_07690, partial [Planctomycetota bacterium]